MPVKPVKTGLCAFGMSGRVFHAPFLNCMPEFELSAVTERHHKTAQKVYPRVKSYDSVEQMLADSELELIIVNTPNITHFAYAKKALLAGKNVIVEKPFAVTAAETQELIQTARKENRFLCAYQNRRWDSDFLSVKEVIESGKLGKIFEASFYYDRYRAGLNPKQHKEIPQKGVGLLYDLGSHLIDQAIALFGKPEAVSARIHSLRPGSRVDDYFFVHLFYPDFNCFLKAGLLIRASGPAYIVHGTKGSFVKDRTDIQEKSLINGMSPCTESWGKEESKSEGRLYAADYQESVSLPVGQGDYKKFFKTVYSGIRTGAPPVIPLEDTLLNTQITEAALESASRRSVVRIG